MPNYPRKIAVLTGDLARSTSLSAGEIDRAMTALSSYADENRLWIGDNFTRQSGDGWQIVVPYPEHAVRSAIAARAALRALGPEFETYLSIAVGDLDNAPPEDLNEATNDLFVNSGRELSILKDRAKTDGVMIAHWDMGYAAATAFLADHISQGWTPAQAEAMALFLDPYSDELSYTDAALQLGKTRQAVTKSLKAAGKDAVLKALFFLEAALRAAPQDQSS